MTQSLDWGEPDTDKRWVLYFIKKIKLVLYVFFEEDELKRQALSR